VNYDLHFDGTRRAALLSSRAALKTTHTTSGVAWSTADLDKLWHLVEDLLALAIDDPQFTADEIEVRRSLDSNGLPLYPEYRHEFLCRTDADYFAAWAWDHSEEYQADALAEPRQMLMVERGRIKYTYRENDPDIVDRSLLRNGLRELREGETLPPQVIGEYAPAFQAVLPSIVRLAIRPSLA